MFLFVRKESEGKKNKGGALKRDKWRRTFATAILAALGIATATHFPHFDLIWLVSLDGTKGEIDITQGG